MTSWINYKELKQEIAFADVLDHYKVEHRIKGEQVSAQCPLPGHSEGGRALPLSIHTGRNIFQCFGCRAKGNILDFIALLEGLDPADGKAFRKAALLAQERFLYKDNRSGGKQQELLPESNVLINPPLDFSLKGLDSSHPYFKELGLVERTVAHFGLGFCSRGYLKGRIAIPLHATDGRLIGYTGKAVNGSLTPALLFPTNRKRKEVEIEFRKSDILYNGNRIVDPVDDLIVVETIADVWRLWQLGYKSMVALMDGECSEEQAVLISDFTTELGRVWIMAGSNNLFDLVGSVRSCRMIQAAGDASLGAMLPEHLRRSVPAM